MGFSINYVFSNAFESFSEEELIKADEMTLRYNLFPGRIYLLSDESGIKLDWDWIPLLDFALCLRDVCNSLEQKEEAIEELDFTESDGRLIFKKELDEIKISTSYSDETLKISYADFGEEVNSFFKKLVVDIFDKNPSSENNALLQKYFQEAIYKWMVGS